jgi:Carboxypeptidase regulatory-like domain
MMLKNWWCKQICVFVLCLAVCALMPVAPPLIAQTSTGIIKGTVSDESGKAVANASVTATSIDTGQRQTANTGPGGTYKLELPAGSYRLTFEAAGFKLLEISSATVSATVPEVLDGKLEKGEGVNGESTPTQQENLPNAPSSSTTAPSLSDLGLSPEQTRGNPQEQALLDKRTHMLKIHQRMGLITTIPLVATVILGPGAGGKSEGTATRDLHVALGALTGDLYGITAYYAIRAPRIPGTKKRGPIKFHEAMAWIHGPGMILTPILGAMAFSQKNNGERVHGIAQAHGPVAIVTAGAFGAALLSVSVKF